jgi:Prp8 binding protein
MICSASDDNTAKIWDHRQKIAAKSFEMGSSQTAVAMSDNHLFCAGIDNSIKAIDLKTCKLDFVL